MVVAVSEDIGEPVPSRVNWTFLIAPHMLCINKYGKDQSVNKYGKDQSGDVFVEK